MCGKSSSRSQSREEFAARPWMIAVRGLGMPGTYQYGGIAIFKMPHVRVLFREHFRQPRVQGSVACRENFQLLLPRCLTGQPNFHFVFARYQS